MSDVGKSRIVGKPRKVVDYLIAYESERVWNLLGEGWELYGTPFSTDYQRLNQAMVKYEVVEPIKLPVRD